MSRVGYWEAEMGEKPMEPGAASMEKPIIGLASERHRIGNWRVGKVSPRTELGLGRTGREADHNPSPTLQLECA